MRVPLLLRRRRPGPARPPGLWHRPRSRHDGSDGSWVCSPQESLSPMVVTASRGEMQARNNSALSLSSFRAEALLRRRPGTRRPALSRNLSRTLSLNGGIRCAERSPSLRIVILRPGEARTVGGPALATRASRHGRRGGRERRGRRPLRGGGLAAPAVEPDCGRKGGEQVGRVGRFFLSPPQIASMNTRA